MGPSRYSRMVVGAAAACTVATVVLYACSGEVPTTAPNIEARWVGGINSGKINLSYQCDNRFQVTNGNPDPATITYQVANSSEQGSVNLPARIAKNRPSVTTFSTQNQGTVSIYLGTVLAGQAANAGVPCNPPPPPPPPPEAQVGQWSSVFSSPIVALHLHVMPNGKVLSWGHDGSPQVWDPATGTFTPAPSASLMFCSGHNFLPDGRLLVAGGHIQDGRGLPNTNLFSAAGNSWQVGSPMTKGRWYPTNTTLANGFVVTIAGTDEGGANVPIPEVWNGSSWIQLTGASLGLPYYPRTFLAPDGRVFYAGEQQQSRYLNTSGAGSWTNGPLRTFGTRDYGSAVMYEPGKILYVGGGPPTSSAEVINLNLPSPSWVATGSMQFARRHLNATVLPTGQVLATGGTSGSGFNNPNGAAHAAEVWDPATGAWSTLASNAVTRIYHSTTVLLPDGRIFHSGSGDAGGVPDELSYEIFSPPYLFKGARPTITGATPASVNYGGALFVETPDGASITKVSFIRLGSATHAFDAGQRFVPLTFGQGTGGLNVTLPAGATIAPPGPYMLFVVNGNGVPSVSRIMTIQ